MGCLQPLGRQPDCSVIVPIGRCDIEGNRPPKQGLPATLDGRRTTCATHSAIVASDSLLAELVRVKRHCSSRHASVDLFDPRDCDVPGPKGTWYLRPLSTSALPLRLSRNRTGMPCRKYYADMDGPSAATAILCVRNPRRIS